MLELWLSAFISVLLLSSVLQPPTSGSTDQHPSNNHYVSDLMGPMLITISDALVQLNDPGTLESI
ncbi:hypothetical protein DPMN_191357 [Dreissena polymorpha]|uniref:Uncharacterized protein n=1 Tax=Dreissena polymorpha TaxID=45954 RepID=A0A9D3Y4T0_DREPO|nr:hypothetical protein DPMN_191357 [Dreissena polymorpha]